METKITFYPEDIFLVWSFGPTVTPHGELLTHKRDYATRLKFPMKMHDIKKLVYNVFWKWKMPVSF